MTSMDFEHATCVGELLGSHLATSLPVTKGRVLSFSSSQVRATTAHTQTPHTAALQIRYFAHLQGEYGAVVRACALSRRLAACPLPRWGAAACRKAAPTRLLTPHSAAL